MKRKSSEYWNERFRQLEEAQNRLAQMSFSDIEGLYRAAQKELEGKINTWYKRLADNNSISMADARKLLSKNELAEFKWSLKDYIKYGKENAVNEKWVKELENASAKFHISKYQALMIDTRQTFEQLFGKQLGIVTETMGNVFENGYYRTAYELQRGVGIGFDVAKLNREEVKLVLSKPWAVDGKNFSERIWGNREKLINEAHNEITKNIITGADPQKAIDAIAKKMNTSKSNAGRLVMTEEAYFSSAAQGKSYKDLGVEKYEILATLDDVTSKLCRSLDGKVFDMKDYKPGVTAPPFHNYCRSTTVPQLDEEIWGVGERAVRDKDGKTYYVPDNIKYPEWEEKFVNGGDKSGSVEVDKSGKGGIINRDYQCELAQKVGKDHYDKMCDLLDGCNSSDICEVWKKFEPEISVAGICANGKECCEWSASINIDLDKNSQYTSWSKPYQTVFHESGHAIDMIAGRTIAGATSSSPNNLYSLTYKNGLFPQTIKREIETLIVEHDKIIKEAFNSHPTDYDWLYSNGYIPAQKYDFFKRYGSWIGGVPQYSKSITYNVIEEEIRALSPYAKSDLSDILAGATKNKIKVGYGHENSYWNHGDWTLATETFAEMMDSTIANTESLETIKKYLPDSYKVFLDMINDLK